MSKDRIIIIGAGPTGLGAAYRLHELGYENWLCVEQHSYAGGLSASFQDRLGFWWDIGGHVLFSHYAYYDAAFDSVMKDEFYTHQRSSWVCISGTFVPYPFQNNIRYLPAEMQYECLLGLIIAAQRASTNKPDNFYEWCLQTFGEGITRHFMASYNLKNWAAPLESMSADWIAERVSVVDLPRILANVIFQRDDVDWGPNNTFKFPVHGATGEIYRRFAALFPEHIKYNRKTVEIDTASKTVTFQDGTSEPYDYLISTMPLDELVGMMHDPEQDSLISAAQDLAYTSGIVVGIGLSGSPPESDRCWIYFPEDSSPFYRVTYFHHYSPHNVPDNNHFSFLCETSYSPFREIKKSDIIDETIQGLINTGIIADTQRNDIASTYVIDVKRSYPIPTLNRNRALSHILPYLHERRIFSRGRFGLWIYEIGNMDHSFVQGADVVDRILSHKAERVVEPYKHIIG